MPQDQTDPLLRRVVVFRHEALVPLLDAAEASGATVELVKDDGVYLAAWIDPKAAPMTVFAVGHESPDLFRTSGADELDDKGWFAQRYRVEQSLGGDDFGEEVSVADLRAASAHGDVVFVAEVRMLPWPEGMPDLFGRHQPIPRLVNLSGPMPAGALVEG